MSNLPYLCLYNQLCDSTTNGTIYDYSAQVLNRPLNVDFNDFRGKFVLFVNVATYWSYTYQYKGEKRRHTRQNLLFLLKVNGVLVIFDFYFSHTGHQIWMHYRKSWEIVDLSFSAFPPTNSGNRSQEHLLKFCQD